MTLNEENKRKLLFSQYKMLEKERNNELDELDLAIQELKELGVNIAIEKPT